MHHHKQIFHRGEQIRLKNFSISFCTFSYFYSEKLFQHSLSRSFLSFMLLLFFLIFIVFLLYWLLYWLLLATGILSLINYQTVAKSWKCKEEVNHKCVDPKCSVTWHAFLGRCMSCCTISYFVGFERGLL